MCAYLEWMHFSGDSCSSLSLRFAAARYRSGYLLPPSLPFSVDPYLFDGGQTYPPLIATSAMITLAEPVSVSDPFNLHRRWWYHEEERTLNCHIISRHPWRKMHSRISAVRSVRRQWRPEDANHILSWLYTEHCMPSYKSISDSHRTTQSRTSCLKTWN